MCVCLPFNYSVWRQCAESPNLVCSRELIVIISLHGLHLSSDKREQKTRAMI